MENAHHLLALARHRKGWSQERVAEAVGVTRSTVSQWERGEQNPHEFYVHRLCDFYQMTRSELGLEEIVRCKPRKLHQEGEQEKTASLSTEGGKKDEQAQSSTTHHSSSLEQDGSPNLFSHAIIELVRELEGVMHLDAPRRRLFQQTLSLLFGVSSSTLGASIIDLFPSVIDEGVSFYSTAIPACWSLVYSGGIEHVEKVLPVYLAHLTTLTQQSSQERKMAAYLASQGYKLANLLDLRREDFGVALQHSKDAFLYGQIADDLNLQVAALIEEALTFQYRKRLPQTFASYQKASHIANSTNGISPIIKGRAYAGLAVACARLGQKQEALRYIGLAEETFPEHPEEDVHFSYTYYSHYYLYLYEGLMYTDLNQPKDALAAYAHFRGAEYAPRRIEIANKEAEAWLLVGDLDHCHEKVENAAALALSTKSDLRYSEAREIYQMMQMKWPHEQKVNGLAHIFQQ